MDVYHFHKGIPTTIMGRWEIKPLAQRGWLAINHATKEKYFFEDMSSAMRYADAHK